MNKPPRFLWGLRKKIMNVKELNLNFNHLTPLFKEAQDSFEFLFNQKYTYIYISCSIQSKILSVLILASKVKNRRAMWSQRCTNNVVYIILSC